MLAPSRTSFGRKRQWLFATSLVRGIVLVGHISTAVQFYGAEQCGSESQPVVSTVASRAGNLHKVPMLSRTFALHF